HKGVEASRGATIPDEAYLDVLFMLIDYSIRSYELLHRPLRPEEKAEVFDVFLRVGRRMELKNLPPTYPLWKSQRESYLQENLVYSEFSGHLYGRYRESLGIVRYRLLLHAQVLLVPGRVSQILPLPGRALLRPVVFLYKGLRLVRLDRLVKFILLPAQYRKQVYQLDRYISTSNS
ncbi:MAG TPA: oxygenase MpaB family protein, partial [Puia sp.]